MFTAFFTFFAAHYQVQTEYYKKFKKKGPGIVSSLELAKNFMWAAIFPALLSTWVLDGGPDEEEDEGYLKWAGKSVFAFATGGMVLVRDVLHGLVSDFGYGGSVFTRFLEALTEGLGRTSELWDEDKEGISRTTIKTWWQIFGYIAKVPARFGIRTYDYFDRYSEGEIDDFSLFEAFVSGKKY